MLRLSPTAQRRVAGFGFLGVVSIVAYWNFFSDGLPIIWGPSASAAEIAEGQELFEHQWAPNDPLAKGDGLGPVFNAKSCATCHFQGGLGGGGLREHNAVSFEIHSRPGDDNFHTGGIHNFSTDLAFRESEKKVRQLFPIVKGRTIPPSSNCAGPTVIPDFDPVTTQSVQTTALFGTGWVDLISDRAIIRNARNRGLRNAAKELSLEFENIPAGRVRYVRGGVGKFGWKAQFATLDEFVAAACANELGLGTPYSEQAKPMTGTVSPSAPDLDKKQFRSLVAFVKTLPKPVELPASAEAARGKEVFTSTGCAICHTPNMGSVKGIYSDFLLYAIEDPPPPGSSGGYGSAPSPLLSLPQRPDDEPKPNEWKTPALWGVADSAPYMHDGSAATLPAAILAHGGDARSVREKYKTLTPHDQAALIAFLGSLKAPPDAPQLRDNSITRLNRK